MSKITNLLNEINQKLTLLTRENSKLNQKVAELNHSSNQLTSKVESLDIQNRRLNKGKYRKSEYINREFAIGYVKHILQNEIQQQFDKKIDGIRVTYNPSITFK